MYKKHFPILNKKINWKSLIYFDSACSYLKNYKTLESINRYYTDFSCCSWDRESSYLGSLLLKEITDTRNNIKKNIWAKKDDYIVFTSGTTDSINKLIFSLDDTKIKTIITSDLEHNSNFLPQLEYSKQKNIDFKVFSYKDILNLEKLEDKLKQLKQPFLLCFTHSSNIIGWNFDIKNISELVHKYGWYILIDDAQYITHNKEDVIKNDIDFLVFSAHKIWWPTWIWILYIKKWLEHFIKYSNKLWWWTIKNINKLQVNYKTLPYFLEWWVQDFAWILWLDWCIDFINEIWYENINNYIKDLVAYFWEKFYKNKLDNYFEILSLKESLIVTLKPKNFNVIDFHGYCNYFLDDYIISFRTWSMCADNYVNNYLHREKNIMRLSFWIYNDKDEIDIFINNLIKYYDTIWI